MKAIVKYTIMMIIAASIATQAYALEVVLKDAVTVESEVVMLSDVVRLGTLDAATRELFKGYEICKAPRAGYKREINKAYLIMKMKQAKLFSPEMSFSGAKYVAITRHEICVTVAEQEASLKAWIAQALNVSMSDFVMEMRTTLSDVYVPAGDVEMVFDGDVAQFKKRNVGVFVEYYVNERIERKQAVSFSLKFKKRVVVAKRAIARGADITMSDVYVADLFVGLYDGVYAAESDLSSQVAKKNIMKNLPIMLNDISAKVVVERGDVVECVIADKNMHMKVSMQACEDGVIGETIKVLNLSTKTALMGQVVKNGVVELSL